MKVGLLVGPYFQGEMPRVALLVLLAAAAACDATHGVSVRVDAGDLVHSNGTREPVGMTSSALQVVIDEMFAPVSADEIGAVSFFNSSELRYLDLSGGTYTSDVTLRLPSMAVLRLNLFDAETGFKLSAAASSADKYPSVVSLFDVSFSAVIGGFFDATANASFEAIHVEQGSHNSVRDVRVNGTGLNLIQVRDGNRHEIASATFDGTNAAKRCIWLIATSSALVHDNEVRNCVGHALDLDAYTQNSAAWSNLCEDCGSQGIFVEETAHNNFVFNNTVRRSAGNGIDVYSMDVGPVSANIIAGNTLEDNGACGLTSGGYGHDPIKHAESNIFVGNVARRNGAGSFKILHGAVQGDHWVSNDGEAPEWVGSDPHSSANVSVFDP